MGGKIQTGLIFLLMISLLLTGCDPQIGSGNINAQAVAVKDKVLDYGSQFVHNKTVREEAFIDTASGLARGIRATHLSEIDLQKVQTYEDFTSMIDKFNLLIDTINQHTSSTIGHLSKERQAYDEFTRTITKYTPLMDNYNDLIRRSHSFQSTEEEAKGLYVASAKIGIEAFVIVAGSVHKLVFGAVGETSAKLGILEISKICGPCVSVAMSTTYWKVHNGIAELAGWITEKALT